MPGCGSSKVSPLEAQETNSGIKAILNHYSARNFTSGNISQGDLDQILLAGIKAPSANNRQPWVFTVVQSQSLAKRIVSNIVDGNVLILISAQGNGKTNGAEILDCALAAENMYLAAQALGLGSRIYTGPIDTVNNGLKTELELPAGYSAVVLVRVGKVQPGIDAVSAASSRKPTDAVVSYK